MTLAFELSEGTDGRRRLGGAMASMLTSLIMTTCALGDSDQTLEEPHFEGSVNLAIPVEMGAPLSTLPDRRAMKAFVDETHFTSDAPGDIYFILIDTLRNDVLRDNAPHITQFIHDNFSVRAVANGAATQHATFSVFNSLPSHLTMQELMNPPAEELLAGALPLQIFKKLGYTFHAHGLHFDCVDKLAEPGTWDSNLQNYFGYRTQLIERCDGILPGESRPSIEVSGEENALTDSDVVRAFEEHVQDPGPNFHFIYLFGTHTPYKWDLSSESLLPSSVHAIPHPDLLVFDAEDIRNGYKNSVRTLDAQVKKVLDAIKAAGKYEEATVIFVSDHGESLGEKPPSVCAKDRNAKDGLLYIHGNSMYRELLDVPIAIKLPTRLANARRAAALADRMHSMDVFPSVLDGMNVRPLPPSEFMFGRSIFDAETRAAERSSYSVLPNGSDATDRMVLVNDSYKVFIRVGDEEFYRSSTFEIVNITDLNDNSIYATDAFAPFGITPAGTLDPAGLIEKIKRDFAEGLSALYALD